MIVHGMGGMGGELTDAFKKVASNVGEKLTTEASRVSMALRVAAFASVAAALFAAMAAWNTRR